MMDDHPIANDPRRGLRPWPPPPPGWWLASDGNWYPPARDPRPPPPDPPVRNGLAIIAFLASFFVGIGSIPALVFGYTSRRQIDQSDGRQTGRGLASAAIVLGWIGVALTAAFTVAFVVSSVIVEMRGIDPIQRIRDLHRTIEDAGIHCDQWDESIMSGTIGPTTVADGTCVLASGAGTLQIQTFREESDKHPPAAPCPRVEGDAFWIDTSDVTNPALVAELAEALDAEAVPVPC